MLKIVSTAIFCYRYEKKLNQTKKDINKLCKNIRRIQLCENLLYKLIVVCNNIIIILTFCKVNC